MSVLVARSSAQTQAQYDSIKSALLTIQQKAANSLAVLDAPSRPANWQELIDADMDAAIAAANTASATSTMVAMTAVTARKVSVPAGANLQSAINSAVPGDTLVLQAGATYTGLFNLPAKSGTGFVTITSSAIANLPEGRRVSPANASSMPKIVNATGAPAFLTQPGAHHYRLSGLEVTCASGVYCNTLIQIGTGGETTNTSLPYSIELDRLYVHGSSGGGKRGVQLNGKSVTLKNSHLSGFFSTWQETQATTAWNTPGPLTIENNYLEAAGMGIMIGGAEPALVGATPSDIAITRNHVTRPLAWRTSKYVIKNLIELKTGRRVKIQANTLENTWTASQVGYALVLKRGTENVKTPAVTSDVTIIDNIIRRATAAMIVSAGVANVTFRNNLMEDLGPAWGGAPLFGLYGASGVTIENNTAGLKVSNTNLLMADAAKTTGLVFRANILPHGTWGVKGSGQAMGINTLNYYFPNSVFTKNVLYGAVVNPAVYPTGNYFPSTIAEIGWTSASTGNYKLISTSTYKGNGVNGADPGIGAGPLFP